MEKLIKDTLQTPSGKWSRTSLTMLVSFGIAIIIGVTIVYNSYFLGVTDNRDAIAVFDSFMLLVFGLSGVTVANKCTPTARKSAKDPEITHDEIQG